MFGTAGKLANRIILQLIYDTWDKTGSWMNKLMNKEMDEVFAVQETFLNIINVENSVLLNMFVKSVILFSGFLDEYKVLNIFFWKQYKIL